MKLVKLANEREAIARVLATPGSVGSTHGDAHRATLRASSSELQLELARQSSQPGTHFGSPLR